MKVPIEIESFAKGSEVGQRLVSLLSGAPEEQLLQDIVQCIVDIVGQPRTSNDIPPMSNGVADSVSREAKSGGRYDFSETDSFVEQLMFLHPRYARGWCLCIYHESS